MSAKLNGKPSSIPSYTRTELIEIARCIPVDQLPQLPVMTNINDIPEWRRRPSSCWGEDESTSDLLNDDSSLIAQTLKADDTPIDNFRIVSTSEDDSKLIFNHSSFDPKPPVLIDFANPFTCNRKASDAFQSFPPPLQTRDRSDSISSTRAIGGTLRLGSRTSLSSSFSSSPIDRKGSLNPYAAPFPLPKTTPDTRMIPSLPLPKALPISLPQRPGPLAPIFVKKESATLPQPMSLPTVKPMGPDWLQEDTDISGNERRRRASELPVIRLGQSFSGAASQSLGEKRPERLVRLGESLRQSIASKGQSQKA